jgi:S-(hydroxymethyl)glutathione dehydrogenase / alcohol dehydrogenase
MQALVCHNPKQVRVERIDDPRIEDARDAIVRVTSTAICGCDLHVYRGAMPEQQRPIVLGHEVLGEVVDLGRDVEGLRPGDRVVVPFPIACGRCWFCARKWTAQCEHGRRGQLAGQAQYVRVPFADIGPRKVPAQLSDREALLLSHVLPTGWAALDWARLEGGETVVVFGCGPVGLMAQKAAWLHGAERVIGVDVLPYRLAVAQRVAKSETVDAREAEAVQRIRELTCGRGADVCVDASGLPAECTPSALRLALGAVRRGGRVSIVSTCAADHESLPLAAMMDKAIAVTAGRAPVHRYIDQLLDLIREDQLRVDDIITHVLPLSDAAHAYRLFDGRTDDCVKVILEP